jgi:N-acetylmuramoyl-L-alanine amidase
MAGKFLWILDNGHGQSTPGKRSPILDDGRQLFEYEFNRDIVQRLMVKMKAAHLSYHELVPEVEIDVPLSTRVKRANNLTSDLPKIFLSIHSNAQSNHWGTAHGIETYCYQTASKAERLAKTFQNSLITHVGWKNRGVKTAGFYVLKYTRMPAILTENGFYTNLEECKKLLDPIWRDRIAEAHFLAICEIEEKGIHF